MYEDIGGKIKALAKAWFFIGAIFAIICGIYLIVIDESMVFVGMFLMVGGPLLAYISSWLLYGFGELVDIAYEIEWNTRREEVSATDEQLQQELTKE